MKLGPTPRDYLRVGPLLTLYGIDIKYETRTNQNSQRETTLVARIKFQRDKKESQHSALCVKRRIVKNIHSLTTEYYNFEQQKENVH